MGISDSIDRMIDDKVRTFLESYIELDDFASGKAEFSYDKDGYFARYKNVSLRDTTFNALPLPISLMYGQVGELKITIPSLSSLTNSNNVVSIKRLFLCVKLVGTEEWSRQMVEDNYESTK